jgi:hypothetical protein
MFNENSLNSERPSTSKVESTSDNASFIDTSGYAEFENFVEQVRLKSVYDAQILQSLVKSSRS